MTMFHSGVVGGHKKEMPHMIRSKEMAQMVRSAERSQVTIPPASTGSGTGQ
jgi:hypothetical protein